MDRRILTKHKQALQKAERVNILQYPGVCQLFVLACIVTDAFTLYTIFDIMLKQRPSLTWVITVMVATVLNITPMIAAVCINNHFAIRKIFNYIKGFHRNDETTAFRGL